MDGKLIQESSISLANNEHARYSTVPLCIKFINHNGLAHLRISSNTLLAMSFLPQLPFVETIYVIITLVATSHGDWLDLSEFRSTN